MNPFEILLWVLAGAIAVVVAALAIAIAILIIRAALTTHLGKEDSGS